MDSLKSAHKHVRFLHGALYHISHKSGRYAALLACVVAVAFFAYMGTHKKEKESYTVSMIPIKQYVQVSGSVQSSKDASLSFQTSGTISKVFVKTGDRVRQNQTLASLSSGDQEAAVLSAEAVLANANITLDQLKEGPRKEEIAIKEQTYQNAKDSLDQTYLVIPDVIRNVEATTGDVLKNKLAGLFISQGDHYVLSFTSCDQSLQSVIEKGRTDIENILASYQKKSSTITTISTRDSIDAVIEEGYNATVQTNALIGNISNLLLTACSVQNSSLDTYRTTLSTVRTTMTTLFSDLSTKRTSLTTAKNTYTQAARDLDLTKAGTDPYKIKAQAAVVTQYEANLMQARQAFSKTKIVAPFDGIIGDVSATEGETATLGKTVITMIGADAFEIEAKVPEIDIVKVIQGSEVEVTLDAYGKGSVFPATVTRISPTATTEGTVPMYKVTITFKEHDDRIKSVMTANVNIVTQSKVSAIAVPARFVTTTNDTFGSVILQDDKREVIQSVSLGMRGADGLIEITGGLKPGDVLLMPEIGTRAAQKEN